MTVVAAVAIAHVFLHTTVEGYRLTTAIGGTPAYLFDGFVRGDFGATFGGGCRPPQSRHAPTPSSRAPAIRRARSPTSCAHRVPIDLQLLLGGVLLGTLAGVWGGRRCAMRPGSYSARVLHVAIAFLLACPPYFLAYMILIWFADGSGTMLQIPFVSA